MPVGNSNQPPLPFVFSREQMIQFTHQYEGERFPDGRPRVPDSILERMKKVTCEQAWTVLREHGYTCQYQGKWVNNPSGSGSGRQSGDLQFHSLSPGRGGRRRRCGDGARARGT